MACHISKFTNITVIYERCFLERESVTMTLPRHSYQVPGRPHTPPLRLTCQLKIPKWNEVCSLRRLTYQIKIPKWNEVCLLACVRNSLHENEDYKDQGILGGVICTVWSSLEICAYVSLRQRSGGHTCKYVEHTMGPEPIGTEGSVLGGAG